MAVAGWTDAWDGQCPPSFKKILNLLLQRGAVFVKNGKILEWIDATSEIEPGRYKADATNRIASETGPL
jgi:hypothetical protein